MVPGVRAAEQTLRSLGFIHHCASCSYREVEAGILPGAVFCPRCGRKADPIGPLWIGAIADRKLAFLLHQQAEVMRLGSKARLSRLLKMISEEEEVLPHYDYHKEAKRLGVSPPAMDTLLTRLIEAGYAASRAHYSGTALLTDAPVEVFEAELSR